MRDSVRDDFERPTGDDAPPEHIPDEPVDLSTLGYGPNAVPEPAGEAGVAPEAAMESAGAAALEGSIEPGTSRKRGRKPDSYETRIEVLSLAIERYPDAAVNYVLRGEAWLALGYRVNALEDFRAALSLADGAADGAQWGYVERALADRAREGLRQTGM